MDRALVVALIVALGASVQAQTTQSSSFEAPRTPWGDPDIGGLWNSSTVTPVERPEGQTEAFLTAEEVAATERAVVDGNARANAPSVVRTEPLPVGGNVGAYNSFWLDRGTKVVPTRRTSIIIDPPNGRLPALTPDTARRLASPEAQRILDIQLARLDPDSYEQLDLNDRCIWYRGIPTFSTAYNNNYHLFQTPDYVVILQEHIHDTRVIPLDGRPHASERIPQLRGDSRGHWAGDTLVVETTNFRKKGFLFIPGPTPQGGTNWEPTDALRVVERFTRIGPDILDYEFTVDAPNTWSRPWTGSSPWARSEGPMFEYACHEGNYGLLNILTGARVQELTQVPQ
ncbi:MAG: hypothetical protein IH939_19855 [Acidobacteria bacterium]|nr:hypothetical protein [Acidobacteriota bacterium]